MIEPNWHTYELVYDDPSIQIVEPSLLPWYQEQDSLSAKIVSLFGEMSLSVLDEYWSCPLQSEARLLNISQDKPVWVRLVSIFAGQYHLMQARTIFTKSVMNILGHKVFQLNNKPLGGIIFSNKTRKRLHLEYAEIKTHHKQYTENIFQNEEVRWAKRTYWQLYQQPFLITELFNTAAALNLDK